MLWRRVNISGRRSYRRSPAGSAPPYLVPNLEMIRGEREIMPGVSVLPTPGHTPGHQSVLVETANGRYAIAGDAVMSYENLERGLPPGFLIDVDEAMDSMTVLQERADHILPAHDYRLFAGERVVSIG